MLKKQTSHCHESCSLKPQRLQKFKHSEMRQPESPWYILGSALSLVPNASKFSRQRTCRLYASMAWISVYQVQVHHNPFHRVHCPTTALSARQKMWSSERSASRPRNWSCFARQLLAAIWPAIFVPNSILHIIYILTFFVALVIVSFKVSLSTVSWAFDQPRCALRAYVRRLEDTSPYDDDIEDMPESPKRYREVYADDFITQDRAKLL